MNEKQPVSFNCPLCQSVLISIPGTKMNPADGVTLYCNNLACPAQEVFGHANNEANAYEIIKQKYH